MREFVNRRIQERRTTRFLTKLQGRVDRAVEAAPKVQLTPDQRAIKTRVEKPVAQTVWENRPPDDMIQLAPPPEQPWEVIIGQPEHYPTLLTMAYRKLYPPEDAEREANKDAGHELEHAAPGLGEPELTIGYGVGFLRDTNQELGAHAFLRLSGRTTAGKYREIFSAPTHLSPSDEAALSQEDDRPPEH